MRALSFPLSLLLALSGLLSLNSSHVFVVVAAATVVIAHTIALSGLGPGANFIQQFNSIIGSGYGYLFYTFLLIISVILAGNMASVFCHMFALFFFLSFLLCSRLYVCVCLCEIATSTLIFSVANQFADRLARHKCTVTHSKAATCCNLCLLLLLFLFICSLAFSTVTLPILLPFFMCARTEHPSSASASLSCCCCCGPLMLLLLLFLQKPTVLFSYC